MAIEKSRSGDCRRRHRIPDEACAGVVAVDVGGTQQQRSVADVVLYRAALQKAHWRECPSLVYDAYNTRISPLAMRQVLLWWVIHQPGAEFGFALWRQHRDCFLTILG